MSTAPIPAELDLEVVGADGLVEMERKFIRLLAQYDELETAWPTCQNDIARAVTASTISSSRA